jgi:hypothetical protein
MKFSLYIKDRLVKSEASSQCVRDALREVGIQSSESKAMIAETLRTGSFCCARNFGEVTIFKVIE